MGLTVASRSQIPQLVVDLDGGSPTIVAPVGFDVELEGAEVLLLHVGLVRKFTSTHRVRAVK